MRKLKIAAQQAFERVYARQTAGLGHVERVSVDVDLDGQQEIVSLRLHRDGVHWSCTCGELECKHAQTALAFVADAEGDGSSVPDRITSVYEPAPVVGRDRTADQSDQAEEADAAGLRNVLVDLVATVVRSGVKQGVSPSIDEAVERLLQSAPSPVPLGISRWVGRLREALGARDPEATARVLDGAVRVGEDLASSEPDAEARRRILSWMGALSHEVEGVKRVSDLTLVELAREWLPGVDAAGVERRYLLDLDSGEVYREERAAEALSASLGPCPRLINAGLATVEQGATPQRIRLLQYATTPGIESDVWDRVAGWSLRSFEPLVERYREAVRVFPGLAEPFVLVTPDAIEGDDVPLLVDDGERPLPGEGDRATLSALRRSAADGEVAWVAGRLVDPGGRLSIAPLAIGTLREGRLCYAQL
jgi:hypothetical protein